MTNTRLRTRARGDSRRFNQSCSELWGEVKQMQVDFVLKTFNLRLASCINIPQHEWYALTDFEKSIYGWEVLSYD